MVLIEAVKGSGTWLKIDPPLYLYEKDNIYTEELQALINK